MRRHRLYIRQTKDSKCKRRVVPAPRMCTYLSTGDRLTLEVKILNKVNINPTISVGLFKTNVKYLKKNIKIAKVPTGTSW